MAFLRDVLFNTRGTHLLAEDVQVVREASLQANLRSIDRLTATIDDTLAEHRKLQGRGGDDGPNN